MECIETEWERRSKDGYGRQGNRYAHRVALEEKLGRPLRPGMKALYTCDNPPCVNPEHLYEGTHGQNMRDMIDRGRHPWAPQPACANGHEYSLENTIRYPSTPTIRHCRKCLNKSKGRG
jgi:hypothetical protein